MLIAGQLSFLRVKVTCDNLVSFTFIFHFLASSLRCCVPGGCVRLPCDLRVSHYIVLYFLGHSDVYVIKVVDRRMRKIKTVHLQLIS